MEIPTQTPRAAEFLLQTESLTKIYPDGAVQALMDVTVGFRQGEYVAIMGPSGSGKSTLLNMLGALDRPTSGEVLFEGRPLSQWGSLDRFRSEKIGFVFQSFCLLPTLTALENVQIPMFETSLTVRQRVAKAKELLTAVGLAHRAAHLPTRLSVGERQRVAIARALANDPVVLLADEPTGNLDSRTSVEIIAIFQQLNRQHGITVILVTHEPDVAAYTSRMIHFRDGRIVRDERVAVPRDAATELAALA